MELSGIIGGLEKRPKSRYKTNCGQLEAKNRHLVYFGQE